MTAQDVLDQALERGVFLYVEDEQLKYRAKTGALSTEMRRQLGEHRGQIVAHLKRIAAGEHDRIVPPPVLRRPGIGPVPLSYAQQRLWFIDRLGDGSAQYLTQSAHRLTGRLDLAALHDALITVLARHESLRTVFVDDEGTPTQIVLEDVSPDLTFVDLRGLPSVVQEREVTRLVALDARHPFDLRRDLMCRATVIMLAEEAQVLIIDLHHIATDRWSQAILQREIVALYAARRAGQAATLPPVHLQYADYAVWQRTWLQGEALTRQLDFWKHTLRGAPDVHGLPLDRERPLRPTYAGASVRCRVPRATLDGIRAICKHHDVTLFMFLQTAIAILIARYSDETDIVIGTPVAGRVQPELEPLIGLFVNTLALRTRLHDNPRVSDLLLRQKQHLLDALAHQHLPFDMVVEALRPRRSPSYPPTVQILFSLQESEPRHFSLPGLTVESVGGGTATNKVDLILLGVEAADALSIYFGYSTEVFRAATIEAMSAHFAVLLDRIAAAPDQRVGELDLLTTEERTRQLAPRDGNSGAPVYVLNAAGQLLPDGVPGERCVPMAAGTRLPDVSDVPARDQRAAPRIVPNPFAHDASDALLCRTGDRVRWRPDGTLESLGTIADQIAIGGVRVPLARVHAALNETAWVARMATTSRRDASGRDGLVVYVVPIADRAAAAQRNPSLPELRRTLAAAIEEYAVPLALILVEQFPVDANGMLAVEALPLPADAFAPPAVMHEPTTETEARMMPLWRAVLRVDAIGLSDNFFAAGGHSLSMIVLIKRIAQTFEVDVPLGTFIENPTIQAVSRVVDDAHAPDAPDTDTDDQRAQPMPLSIAQEHFWLRERLDESRRTPTPHASLAQRITGALDLTRLEEALDDVLRRHDVLRAYIETDGRRPIQRIATDVRLPIAIVRGDEKADAAAPIGASQIDAWIEAAVAEETGKPFDVSRAPLLRATVLRRAERDHVLVITAHPIAGDRESLDILMRDLAACYEARVAGQPARLAPLDLQFVDYARWQRETLTTERRQRLTRYWASQWPTPVPRLTWPAPAQSVTPARRSDAVPIALSRTMADRLTMIGQGVGAPLRPMLVAVLQTLLHRRFGVDEVGVGLLVTQRDRFGTDALIGPLTNTLPLRTNLSGDPTFLTLLEHVRDVVLGAEAHQALPFALVCEAVQPAGRTARSPQFQTLPQALVQVLLDLQPSPLAGTGDLPGLSLQRVPTLEPVPSHDLTVRLTEHRDGLHGRVEFDTRVLARADVERLVEQFLALVDAVIDDPTQRLSALSLERVTQHVSAALGSRPDTTRPLVSVIIPARGTASTLALCLEALRHQTLPAADREIIVVDNGLDDPGAVQRQFPEITLVPETRVGSYASRNRGVAEARGEFVAFTDSDCVPRPDWIEQSLTALRTTDASVVGGKIEFVGTAGGTLTCYEVFEQRMFDWARAHRMITQRGFAVTANLVTDRGIFDRVGLFDGELRSSGDREWTQRAVAKGETLRYCDAARVQHPSRKTFMPMCRKIVRLRGGFVSLAKSKGFRSYAWLLRRFTLLDPAMYESAVVCSRGRGIGTRVVFFGGVMLMATAATVETIRVLCGARGYRG